MKVLIACECSGIERTAFRMMGHDAYSCDLKLSEDNSPAHIQGDVLDVLNMPWDMVIAHPPCTDLASSGARWFKYKNQGPAIAFFMRFTELNCKWAIENPVGVMSSRYRKPDQIVQPWQFGHGEVKATCLWLHDLPILVPTNIVTGRVARCHLMPPSDHRSTDRSRAYPGIAAAMAEQWGHL